jgi:transposase
VHVLVNEDGLPLSVVVGPGNEHDRRRFEEVLGGLRVKKSGRGRARTRPKGVYADAADDAKAIREGLRRRGIRAGIPKNPRRGKGTRGGKRAFQRRKAYRRARSSVERFFGWLKGGFRRLTVRHERRLSTFLAFVLLACFLIAWRILR